MGYPRLRTQMQVRRSCVLSWSCAVNAPAFSPTPYRLSCNRRRCVYLVAFQPNDRDGRSRQDVRKRKVLRKSLKVAVVRA